jgi:hypothetical protein
MYTGEAGDVAAIALEAILIVLLAVLKSSLKRGAAGRG